MTTSLSSDTTQAPSSDTAVPRITAQPNTS